MPPLPETVGDLATGVLQAQTATFLAYCPGARAGRDPRDVHQMRVAARRMRAALRLFADVLPPTETEHVNAELKWVAGQLGHVRDLDVQLRRLAASASNLQLSGALEPYVAWLQDQRRQAQQALAGDLISARFMSLVEALHQVGHWPTTRDADTQVMTDAPRRLDRVFKVFSKRARRLRKESPLANFHGVRIRAKRLRYAAEFFEPSYGKPARKFIARLTHLQDILGELQDGVVAAEHIQRAVEGAAHEWPTETAVALGQLLHYDAQRAKALKRQFQKRYEEVAGKAWRRLESNVVMS
jgi:CHAD domain-containing protein